MNIAAIKLHEKLSYIPDPRSLSRVQYRLTDLLFQVVAAVMANCECWDEIEDFGKDNFDWLKKFTKFVDRPPSSDTIRRVFSRISIPAFRKCFKEWIIEIFGSEIGSHIAIDGKQVCATSRRNDDPLTILSAFASEAGICLGQLSVAEKSNEITGIPQLLEDIDISGSLVTIDAIGCQIEITSKIVEKGADYLIAVKGNQPSLQQDVVETFGHFRDHFSLSEDVFEVEEKGHGRKEKRCYRVIDDISWLPESDFWPGLKSVVKVESSREMKGKASYEERYYISSRSDTAEVLGRMIRSHWAIENNLHWVLDVAYREDKVGVRDKVAAENLGLIRKITHALIKRGKPAGISFKRQMKRYGRRPDLLFETLQHQVV